MPTRSIAGVQFSLPLYAALDQYFQSSLSEWETQTAQRFNGHDQQIYHPPTYEVSGSIRRGEETPRVPEGRPVIGVGGP